MPTLSIRLDGETASMVDRVAARTGKTKSKILREAIAEYIGAADEGSDAERPYDKIMHLIGSWDSGGQQLSTRTGEKFAEALKRASHCSASS